MISNGDSDDDLQTRRRDGGLLTRLDALRAKLATETHDDVKRMLGFQIEDVLTEIRRRNEAREKAVAEAKLS